MNLDELQRLAEGADNGCEEAWPSVRTLREVLGERDACYVHAMSPDTAKKLIAVALAAQAVVFGGVGEYFDALVALRTALEELKHGT